LEEYLMIFNGIQMWKRGLFAGLSLSVAMLACNFPGATRVTPEVNPTRTSAPNSTDIIENIPTATPDFSFSIQRQAPQVFFGPGDPLDEIASNDAQPFPEGDLVTTDLQGEALIAGELDGEQCRIFVFFNTQLRKSACPESGLVSGNASCVENGSAVFQNCANHLVMTPSGQAQLAGTWLQVFYVPDQKMTAYIVADGRVRAAPIDDQGQTLAWTTIQPGEFYYTTPDLTQPAVPGLPRRQPVSWDRLPALTQFYDLTDWFERSYRQVSGENLDFREPASLTGLADLIVSVERADPQEEGFPLEWYNQLSDTRYYKIPIRMRITNRGGQPTGEFKLSAEAGTPNNWFVRPLAAEGQPVEGYYAFVKEGLPPGGERILYGMVVIVDVELASQPMSLVVTVDSCAGDEIFTDYCRVQEADESNNQSERLEVPPRE